MDSAPESYPNTLFRLSDTKFLLDSVIGGPSGVGKAKWILRLVDNIDQICPGINQIVYCYEVWQSIFNEYSEKIRFRQGAPVLDDFKKFQNCLLILDDMMFTENSLLSKIFTIYSHHYRFSVLFTTQNLFHKGLRELSLNAKFMVLFKNCRDKKQVSYFLSQIYSQKYKSVLQAYIDATTSPHVYLLIDLRCEVDNSERLRTNIFLREVNYSINEWIVCENLLLLFIHFKRHHAL